MNTIQVQAVDTAIQLLILRLQELNTEEQTLIREIEAYTEKRNALVAKTYTDKFIQ